MRANNEQQFLNALGRKIAQLRVDKKITQEQLAYKAGLDRVAIAYIETGKRKPKVSSIYKIAIGLNVHPKELFEDL